MSDGTDSNSNTANGNPLEHLSIWDGLNTSSDPRAFVRAWLEIVCAYIDANIHLGVVVLSDAAGAGFAPAGVWPDGAVGTPAVTSAIESAINGKLSRQIHHLASFRGQNQQRIVLAAPLVIAGKVHGAVAVDIEQVPQERLTEILRQLDWGLLSLEALVHRTRRDSADRLVTVLDLVATSLHHGRFQAAATAVATELAGILQCERVSIGFLKGGHTEVRALSHSASFGKKANIIRDLGACMDEAIDQQVTVAVPPLDGGPMQVTRFHEQLLKSHGEGAVCTIPFADGDGILGAITLERPTGTSFDAATLQLCEHAASLLGPVLESRRRDDRWLGSKAWDSLRQHARNLVGPRHAGLKLGGFSALFAVLFFSFASGDYRITADATLEGALQRAVAVPIAGFIGEANARAGDVVKAG
ncbi:MAG: GAF domain-containing protein, partial [Halieaceae bacterium]|nr:GAF domain-containing protein [Halieaceae bacterium]